MRWNLQCVGDGYLMAWVRDGNRRAWDWIRRELRFGKNGYLLKLGKRESACVKEEGMSFLNIFFMGWGYRPVPKAGVGSTKKGKKLSDIKNWAMISQTNYFGVILVSQLCAQLAHVTSYGWWRGSGGSPLHQSQLATWTSCVQSCAQGLCHQNFSLFWVLGC